MFRKEDLPLTGAFVLYPQIFEDSRGCFFESFHTREFGAFVGENVSFAQENEAHSRWGVLRGLHFQKPPYDQAKLVRAARGKVLDVIVDIRKGSPHFGKHVSVVLSEENFAQLYVPSGFAHGYISLSERSVFQYKCSNFYHPEAEGGLYFGDDFLNIDWQFPLSEISVAEKDKKLDRWATFNSPFTFAK